MTVERARQAVEEKETVASVGNFGVIVGKITVKFEKEDPTFEIRTSDGSHTNLCKASQLSEVFI